MSEHGKPLERDPITKDPLLDHEYDGIRELDNPLPGWWKATFYITIVFAVVYFGYYHLGPGPNLSDELASDRARVQDAIYKAGGGQQDKAVDVAAIAAIKDKPEQLAVGKSVYDSKCMACHGPQGQGLIGPNLTDKHWIYGKGQIPGIYNVVKNGAKNGMVAWGPSLTDEELNSVVAYVTTLAGTNPPNPKAPQGNLVE